MKPEKTHVCGQRLKDRQRYRTDAAIYIKKCQKVLAEGGVFSRAVIAQTGTPYLQLDRGHRLFYRVSPLFGITRPVGLANRYGLPQQVTFSVFLTELPKAVKQFLAETQPGYCAHSESEKREQGYDGFVSPLTRCERASCCDCCDCRC